MIARLTRSIAQAEAAPPPWSLTWAWIAVAVAGLAHIGGSIIAFTLTQDAAAAPLLGWLIGGLVTVAFIWQSRRREREALRLQSGSIRLWIYLLLGLGLAVLIDAIGIVLTQSYDPAPELASIFGLNVGIAGWLLAAIFMLAVQPVAEELLFRGVLYPALASAFGGWLGWLLSAAAYALFHLIIYASPVGNPFMILVQPLLAGLLFSTVRANTRTTSAAIAAHVGFGIFALLKVLVVPLP